VDAAGVVISVRVVALEMRDLMRNPARVLGLVEDRARVVTLIKANLDLTALLAHLAIAVSCQCRGKNKNSFLRP
jgi:hypothetical protein